MQLESVPNLGWTRKREAGGERKSPTFQLSGSYKAIRCILICHLIQLNVNILYTRASI